MSDRSTSEHDDVEVSRRKFLQWAAYVPPTLMGILASTSVAEAATCNPPSACNPSQPCNPDS